MLGEDHAVARAPWRPRARAAARGRCPATGRSTGSAAPRATRWRAARHRRCAARSSRWVTRSGRSSMRSRSGGQVQPHALEAVEEIGAERPLRRPAASRSWCVAAITRTSAAMVRVPPTRSNSRSCSTRRILACMDSGMSPISSRKSVPSLGELEAAGPRPHRAGEGAALVAEQLGLEQPLGDRRAVDRDERPVLARRSAGGSRGPAPPCRCRSRPGSARSGRWARRAGPSPPRA